MNSTVFITNLISAFLLPPLNLIALGALGFFLQKKWPRLGSIFIAGSLMLLAFISMPIGALMLIRPLESLSVPLRVTHNSNAQAIVVLGGGRIVRAAEYGGLDVPNAVTLVRLRYAATLQKQTGLPVLVTGGAPDGAPQSEAAQMARVLREDFSTPVTWLEEASDTTAQNAQFSARILQRIGARRILLVTDAMHMPRAQRIFARNGFDVIPAPTRFVSRTNVTAADFVPNGFALYQASFAMHEWIGMGWYWLRY